MFKKIKYIVFASSGSVGVWRYMYNNISWTRQVYLPTTVYPQFNAPTLINAPPSGPKIIFFPSRNWQNNMKSLFADFLQNLMPPEAFKRGYMVGFGYRKVVCPKSINQIRNKYNVMGGCWKLFKVMKGRVIIFLHCISHDGDLSTYNNWLISFVVSELCLYGKSSKWKWTKAITPK